MSEERKATERLLFRGFGFLAILAAVIWLLPEVWDKLSPFIIAIPIAAALQPVIRFMEKKMKMKRSPASLILVLLLLFLTLGALVWLLAVGIGEVSRIVNHSGDLVSDTINTVREAVTNLLTRIGASTDPRVEQWIRNAMNDVIERLGQWGTGAAGKLVSFSLDLARSLPYFVIYISFLTIGLYFITKDYDNIRSYLPAGARRKQDSRTTMLTKSTLRSLFGYLRVQGTFGVIVWIVSWIVLEIFRFPYAGLIALGAGVTELIPMIGSGVPYFITAAVLFLTGSTGNGFVILGLTLGLQLLRRVLEPKLMADNIGITPLQSLIGMFVGMRFGGIAGLIGGPVLMSVIVGALKGGLFASTIRDCRTIADYLRRRWK